MTRTLSSWFLLALISLFCFSAEAGAHTVITRTSDGETVTVPQLAAAAKDSQVIVVGESHDNDHHHELQLDLIRSLNESKLPLAIGIEMVQSDFQSQLDAWSAGKLSEEVMQTVFELNWSGWPLYREIFLYARDNRIPMIALNVPLHIVRKVSQQGFSSLTLEEKGDLPAGTSCDLRNPQIAFLRRSFQGVSHHGENGKMFSNFCEAQTVRNSGMALNTARYLEKQPGRRIVVLTGIWHAVKYGIPDQLQRLGKLSYTVILPETPFINKENAGSAEADYLVEQ
uniref:Haem-binding uptake Tiki superfamily ChaN domain-containing protein n=1 Tax=Geobacter sp. (strain M21) TaxID=443144 RepID=C6DZP0_GEOSM